MSNYKGLAVGAFGGSQIWQDATDSDALTITAITGATGDFLVCETAGGGEVFVVGAAGELTVGATVNEVDLGAGALIPAGQYLRFSTPPTTPPITGLTVGDMCLLLDDTTTGTQLAVCVDTTNNTLMYIPFGTATFSRATP